MTIDYSDKTGWVKITCDQADAVMRHPGLTELTMESVEPTKANGMLEFRQWSNNGTPLIRHYYWRPQATVDHEHWIPA